jgi:hypothetical protein
MFLSSGRKVGRRFVPMVGLVAVVGLVAACGDDDDGATVRESGEVSGSASGSVSASGGASGSASGVAAQDCVYVGNSSEPPTAVVVATLSEFAIELDREEVAGGTVEFVTHNEGEEPHEIVVARFDGEPADLPTADDGTVDEEALESEGGAVIGEIEGFPGSQTCSTAFDLEPGSYVVFCNILEEEEGGEMEAHYAEGMTTGLTVT